MKLFTILIAYILLSSCSGETGADKADEKGISEDQSPRMLYEYPQVDIRKDADLLQELKSLKKKYPYITYVSKTEAGNLHLFATSRYNLPNSGNEKKEPFQKIGMVDGNGKLLLACNYEKIGNPGGIASGCVEVFADGKYGLYNYITNKLVEPQFEVIFPATVMAYVAIGEKDGKFYKIYEDGTQSLITAEKEIPSYQSLSKLRNFDIKDKRISWWVSTTELMDPEYDYDGMEWGKGLIFPPSYLVNLKVIEDYIGGIVTYNDDAGVEQYKTSVEKTLPRNKEVRSFVESFYAEGSDARGYETERKHLVTVKGKNKVIDSKKIFEPLMDKEGIFKESFQSFTFLNDSLVAVKETVFSYEEDAIYACMTMLSYFSIDAKGRIKALYPESIFEMASVIELTPEHFKGFYFINNPDFSYDSDDQTDNVIVTRHLNLKDLQYMRNEVYARHGYIFKDAYWNQTFQKKSWYKGRFTNVDAKITPLEKKNLQFIQQWEKKLKSNENQYTKPKGATYVAAG